MDRVLTPDRTHSTGIHSTSRLVLRFFLTGFLLDNDEDDEDDVRLIAPVLRTNRPDRGPGLGCGAGGGGAVTAAGTIASPTTRSTTEPMKRAAPTARS